MTLPMRLPGLFTTYGYKRAADYEIEVYPPGDTNSDDYTCEIWIPITK